MGSARGSSSIRTRRSPSRRLDRGREPFGQAIGWERGRPVRAWWCATNRRRRCRLRPRRRRARSRPRRRADRRAIRAKRSTRPTSARTVGRRVGGAATGSSVSAVSMCRSGWSCGQLLGGERASASTIVRNSAMPRWTWALTVPSGRPRAAAVSGWTGRRRGAARQRRGRGGRPARRAAQVAGVAALGGRRRAGVRAGAAGSGSCPRSSVASSDSRLLALGRSSRRARAGTGSARSWPASRGGAARGSGPARSRQRPVGADQRVLCRFLGVARIAQHPQGDRVQAILVGQSRGSRSSMRSRASRR